MCLLLPKISLDHMVAHCIRQSGKKRIAPKTRERCQPPDLSTPTHFHVTSPKMHVGETTIFTYFVRRHLFHCETFRSNETVLADHLGCLVECLGGRVSSKPVSVREGVAQSNSLAPLEKWHPDIDIAWLRKSWMFNTPAC